jgi:hypothetical protein
MRTFCYGAGCTCWEIICPHSMNTLSQTFWNLDIEFLAVWPDSTNSQYTTPLQLNKQTNITLTLDFNKYAFLELGLECRFPMRALYQSRNDKPSSHPPWRLCLAIHHSPWFTTKKQEAPSLFHSTWLLMRFLGIIFTQTVSIHKFSIKANIHSTSTKFFCNHSDNKTSIISHQSSHLLDIFTWIYLAECPGFEQCLYH